MSWNDYELNRRAIEMKATASLFSDRMRCADPQGMDEMLKAMKRTVLMARLRLRELKRRK